MASLYTGQVAEPPDRLVVAALPKVETPVVYEALIAAGAVPAEHAPDAEQSSVQSAADRSHPRCVDLHDLDAAIRDLSENPQAHLLLGYRDPTLQVAMALAEGSGIVDAVETVLTELNRVLNAYRPWRDRCTLVNIDQWGNSPAAAIELMNRRLGLALGEARCETAEMESADPAWLAIADYAIRKNPEAWLAVAEASAGSLPIPPVNAPSVDDLLRALGQARPGRPIDPLRVEEDIELLRLQLRQAHEELEHYTNQSDRLTETTESTTARLASLERETRTLHDEIRAKENEIHARQDELRRARSDLDAKSAELLDLNAKLADTARALDDVMSSMSWRITAPLRAILGLFKK